MKAVDYTSAISLIGDSFSARVSVLERLIGAAHYPSIGGYKERLLKEALKSYLPRSVEISTGFVLFLREPTTSERHDFFDDLNQSSYAVSKQCDLIVYDSSKYAPIFQDEGFAVVRPESVLAIIEVKGSLGRQALSDCLENFWDFSEKWIASEPFHTIRKGSVSKYPALILMAWDLKNGAKCTPEIKVEKIRDQICRFFGERCPKDPWKLRPFLDCCYIYSDSIISHCFSSSGNGEQSSGYSLTSGKFLRRTREDELEFRGDKTISALLAHLQYIIDDSTFNRFFAYADELKHNSALEPFSKCYAKVWGGD